MKTIYSLKEVLKKFILDRFGMVVISKNNYDRLRISLSNAFVKYCQSGRIKDKTPGLCCLVFSKDRPVQLHALLRSLKKNVSGFREIQVMHTSHDDKISACYGDVIRLHEDVKFIKESDFRSDLISFLKSSSWDRVMILVDDILFIEETDLECFCKIDLSTYIPSLRMGNNIKFCYTYNQAVKLPELKPYKPSAVGVRAGNADYLVWSWSGADGDWAYPISFDGGIFSTVEIEALAELCEFNAPNSFETSAQWFSEAFSNRDCICFETSRLVNIPYNRVQDESINISMGLSPEFFVDQWNRGKEIDIDAYMKIRPVSPHMELPLQFTDRSDIITN